MLTLFIKEIDIVIQDSKLSNIVATGCIGAAGLNLIQSQLDAGVVSEIRALQCISVAIGFLACGMINENRTKLIYTKRALGFGGIAMAVLIGAANTFISK